MDAWEYIGSSIKMVEVIKHSNKNIASTQCIKIDSKVMSIMPNRIDGQANCHTYE